MKFKAFTWNMQRRRSLLPAIGENPHNPDPTRQKVKEALLSLCTKYDVGLITEPGKDLRACLQGNNGLAPAGKWAWATTADNQSDASACRPLIFCKDGVLSSLNLNFTSGSSEAFRYPAAATWKKDGHTLLLVSLHSTSGYTGSVNTQNLFDQLEDFGGKNRAWSTWLVGGDFNSQNAEFGGSMMPANPTHQTGHTLDGFLTDRYELGVDTIAAKEVHVKKGDFTLSTLPPNIGCFYKGVKVSDHLPVVCHVEVERDDDAMFD